MADPIRSIHIPTAEHRTSPSVHVAYRIDVQAAVRAWSVWRRYSQFHQLHQSLLQIHPDHPPPMGLPPKHYFSLSSTSSSPTAIESRRQGLEEYVQAILTDQDPRWRRTHEWREFLGVPTARCFTEDQFTSGSWLEELRAIQGALRECRALIHRREASAARNNTAEVHRCTLDARRRLQGLSEQVRALDAGLRVLANTSGASGGDDHRGRKVGSNTRNNESEQCVNGHSRSGSDVCRITESERSRRQDLLEAVRADLRALTRQVEGRVGVSAASAVPERDRQSLLSNDSDQSTRVGRHGTAYGFSSGSSDRSLSPASTRSAPATHRVFGREAPVAETPETQSLDNVGLLQHQQMLMRRQDEHLEQFSQVLRRQREIGLSVAEELDLQNRMLDEFDTDVDRLSNKLNRANRQLNKIR